MVNESGPSTISRNAVRLYLVAKTRYRRERIAIKRRAMNYILPTPGLVLKILNRFPATVLSCLLFCSLAIYNNHAPGMINELWLGISFIASVLFTVTQLIFERASNTSRMAKYVIALLILTGLVLCSFASGHEEVSRWNIILFSLASLALIPCASFLEGSASSDHIFTFSFALARQILFAGIISAIVLIGSLAIAVSIGMLFHIQYPEILFDIGVVIASLFFSTFVLVGMPSDFERAEFPFGAPLVQMLIAYVVIPLLVVYGGILYWYFLVLCFTKTLPAGVIVFMVAGFGCVGIFANLALDHSHTQPMAIIKLFKTYFFKLFVVPIFLMALSIGIRIYEHGLTWARLMVVMLVVWFLLVTVSSFTNKTNYLSRFIFVSATFMALITAFSLHWLEGVY